MTETTPTAIPADARTPAPLSLSDLPALGAALDGGIFAGLTTQPDGTHAAVVLLPDRGTGLDHAAALAWAHELGGDLPSRPVAALLFANCRGALARRWHWTREIYEADASCAWGCFFYNGDQHYNVVGYEASAAAVRLIPIKA